MSLDPVEFLAAWYAQQCDGDWEHDSGVLITTLDNPGWSLQVNIRDTDLEGISLETERSEGEDGTWTVVGCDGAMFDAAGDERSLPRLLARFQEFCTQNADTAAEQPSTS